MGRLRTEPGGEIRVFFLSGVFWLLEVGLKGGGRSLFSFACGSRGRSSVDCRNGRGLSGKLFDLGVEDNGVLS